MEDEADLGGPGPTFNPPLYRQRYNSVLEVARKQEPAKVSYQSDQLMVLMTGVNPHPIHVHVGS